MLTTDSKKTDPPTPALTLSCLCLPIYKMGLMHFANVGIFFFGEEGKKKKQKPEETEGQVWSLEYICRVWMMQFCAQDL